MPRLPCRNLALKNRVHPVRTCGNHAGCRGKAGKDNCYRQHYDTCVTADSFDESNQEDGVVRVRCKEGRCLCAHDVQSTIDDEQNNKCDEDGLEQYRAKLFSLRVPLGADGRDKDTCADQSGSHVSGVVCC